MGVLRPAVRLTVGPEVVVGSQMPVDEKTIMFYVALKITALLVGLGQ